MKYTDFHSSHVQYLFLYRSTDLKLTIDCKFLVHGSLARSFHNNTK